MIGIKSKSGDVIKDLMRDERSGAIVAKPDKNLQIYLAAKRQAEKIKDLEKSIALLLNNQNK